MLAVIKDENDRSVHRHVSSGTVSKMLAFAAIFMQIKEISFLKLAIICFRYFKNIISIVFVTLSNKVDYLFLCYGIIKE